MNFLTDEQLDEIAKVIGRDVIKDDPEIIVKYIFSDKEKPKPKRKTRRKAKIQENTELTEEIKETNSLEAVFERD